MKTIKDIALIAVFGAVLLWDFASAFVGAAIFGKGADDMTEGDL